MADANGRCRGHVFRQLTEKLLEHFKIEEEKLFSVIVPENEAHEAVLECIEEHRILRDLLGDLSDGGTGNRWDIKFNVFAKILEHHMIDEECEVYAFSFQLGNETMLLNAFDPIGSGPQPCAAREI